MSQQLPGSSWVFAGDDVGLGKRAQEPQTHVLEVADWRGAQDQASGHAVIGGQSGG